MRPITRLRLNLERGERAFYIRDDSAGDNGVFEQIFANHDYDLRGFAQTAKLDAMVDALKDTPRTPLIIDAGANIGASCVYFADRYPTAQIIAVEPERENCELLAINCQGLPVALVEAAVGSDTTTVKLVDPGRGDWAFRVAKEGDAEGHAVPMVQVPELLARFGSCWPLICKIDIEGGEANLFEKDTEWVNRFPLVIIELHDWMLPGQRTSRNFLRVISALDFDFVYRGENVFCFNNDPAACW